MPTWVLHGPVADAKAFLRQWVLGSGVLIGIWCRCARRLHAACGVRRALRCCCALCCAAVRARAAPTPRPLSHSSHAALRWRRRRRLPCCRFLTPTFFSSARLLVPLQFAFQGLLLTGPTCGSLTSTQFGAAAAAGLSRSLDAAAAAAGIPSCGGASCSNLTALLQLVAGSTLLYLLYRMERANRLAYLAGRARVARDWPFMPGYVQVLLHVLVMLQLCSAAWVGLQCSAARGAA